MCDVKNKLRRYECPKCLGIGNPAMKEESGGWKRVECTLCQGVGLTEKRYIAQVETRYVVAK